MAPPVRTTRDEDLDLALDTDDPSVPVLE